MFQMTTHVKFSSIYCAVYTWGVLSPNRLVFTEDKRYTPQKVLRVQVLAPENIKVFIY